MDKMMFLSRCEIPIHRPMLTQKECRKWMVAGRFTIRTNTCRSITLTYNKKLWTWS